MDAFPAMELVVTSAEKTVQEKNPNKTNIPLDHSCSVCGAPASAHLHYGAIVCYPCRAFFRRGTTKNFQCRTGKLSCPLESTVKNRCRGCRYEKCLEVGMKPEMVDATLVRKNINNGLKKKSKLHSHELFIETDNTPLDLSKAGNIPSDDEHESSTQLFYVFNPPTQTYEPITIISLGDEEEEEVNEVQVMTQCSADIYDTSHLSNVNNIITDHEEVVQTCEETILSDNLIICDTLDSECEHEEVIGEVTESVMKKDEVELSANSN